MCDGAVKGIATEPHALDRAGAGAYPPRAPTGDSTMSRFHAPILALVFAITACNGGEDVTDTEDEPGTLPETGSVSVDIVAADGGVVEVSGGTLDIPAGSLSADTTITAATAAPAASMPE